MIVIHNDLRCKVCCKENNEGKRDKEGWRTNKLVKGRVARNSWSLALLATTLPVSGPGIQESRMQDARFACRSWSVFLFFPSLSFHVSCASSPLVLLSAVRRLLNANIRASGNKLDTSDRYTHSCIFCALQFINLCFLPALLLMFSFLYHCLLT